MKLLSGAFALLALAACTGVDEQAATHRSVTEVTDARVQSVPYAYRPGYGVVESVMRVEAAGTAGAGGTAGRMVDNLAYRLMVRMDDGTLQAVLQDSAGFAVGDRVRLTEDGKVIRL